METEMKRSAQDAGVGVWDSPLGGAYLIWRFVRGFAETSKSPPNLLLVYPALAIVMDSAFAAEIRSARNLAEFAFAFQDSSGKSAKSLAGLQNRIMDMRPWVLRSLEFAIVCRLVELDPNEGTLSLVLRSEASASTRLARTFKDIEGLNAEQVGMLFARTKESDIPYYLGVTF